jgi:drug/metabolite transporter (DMT)-like permease
MTASSRTYAIAFAFLSVATWVTFTLVLRASVARWPIGLLGTFSRMVTLPVLATWVLSTGAGWRRLRTAGVGRWLLLMGAISLIINLLWFGSVRLTTATNCAMLFRLDLLFVVLIGALLGQEKIGLPQLTLVPAMLVGLALLSEVHKFDWGGHLRGDMMVVAAAFGFAVNAFVIRHILGTMDEEAVALYNHAMSSLGFLGLALMNGDFSRAGWMLAQPAAWASIVTLGVIAAVHLPLYYAALRRLQVWRLRAFMLSAPVMAAAVEWPLWGERFTWSQGIGAGIILAGLAVLIAIEARSAAAQTQAAVEP